MKKSMNVLNVKKLMQEEAYLKRGQRGVVTFRVSKDAIREELSFLSCIIEKHVAVACEHALKEKRKTISEEDIVVANGVNIGKNVEVNGS